MKSDRKILINILGETIDPLEEHVERIRNETIGWMLAEACTAMDKGIDIRTMDVVDIATRCAHAVSGETEKSKNNE